jgi:hypothetical protein
MASLTRTEAYLESLPKGLDSFEAYAQKAALYRQIADQAPTLRNIAGRLPAPLAELVHKPRPVSDWISEVHGSSLILATCDLLFASEESYVDFIYRCNRTMLRGPLYRMMMMMVSPATIVRASEGRWAAFHRGMKLIANLTPDEKGVQAQLVYPTNLCPPLMARAYCGAFRAAVEASGGEDVRFTLTAHGPTVATFEGRWK